MFPSRATLMLAACIFLVLVMPSMCEAAYRKPPFNGSIFGKRGNNNGMANGCAIINSKITNFNKFHTDYDSGGKASLSSMCEIVVEACQSWFPQDKK